jgi:hypothetical protein
MRVISTIEAGHVGGGVVAEPVSGETIGCAIGGALAGEFGLWWGASGCIAGGYVVNNWNGWIGDAFGSLNNVNLTM